MNPITFKRKRNAILYFQRLKGDATVYFKDGAWRIVERAHGHAYTEFIEKLWAEKSIPIRSNHPAEEKDHEKL